MKTTAGAIDIDTPIFENLRKLAQFLRQYHRHEVIGMENLPQSGGVLLVVNHSLATYDIVMLFAAVLQEKNRFTRPLADRTFFKFPYLSDLVHRVGGCEGSPENAAALLKSGELVGVAPGGMLEALRPSSERYQIRWENRKGFVRLAMQTKTPIVIAVCPKADDLYEVYPNLVTDWIYKTFRFPVFLARGIGFSPIPRPTKLVHFLSEPMYPPKISKDPQVFNRQVTLFHKKIIKRARLLIAEAIAYRE